MRLELSQAMSQVRGRPACAVRFFLGVLFRAPRDNSLIIKSSRSTRQVRFFLHCTMVPSPINIYPASFVCLISMCDILNRSTGILHGTAQGMFFVRSLASQPLHLYAQVEGKQSLLESSKKELEGEKELLQRGKREASTEADKLDRRREVRSNSGHEMIARKLHHHYVPDQEGKRRTYDTLHGVKYVSSPKRATSTELHGWHSHCAVQAASWTQQLPIPLLQ